MRDFSKAYAGTYSALYPSVENSMREMGKAMWHFAQIKEIVWYQWGYANITKAIHGLEHVYGEYIDSFKEVLAQLGLPLVYPAIPEFSKDIPDLETAFSVCIDLIDYVNEALSEFIEVSDRGRLEPLARRAENIQMENFAPRSWLIQATVMAANGNSASSIDSWMEELLENEGED